MIDSHNRTTYTHADGTVQNNAWAKLSRDQIDWYREQVKALEKLGCHDTTMVMHTPITAYRDAFNVAFKEGLNSNDISIEESSNGSCWNDGYKTSFGVKYEGICCCPGDDGVFDVIKELGSTKHVISGHDHVNNYVIEYEGVKLIYGTKTGPGCSFNPILNGGTVLSVNSRGVSQVWHEYVDISEYLM